MSPTHAKGRNKPAGNPEFAFFHPTIEPATRVSKIRRRWRKTMKRLNLGLSIAAGLLGGVFSHYIWTQPVQAQNQPTVTKEVRAQSFVVVNEKGDVQGVLTFGEPKNGRTSVKLFDANGREIFSAGGSPMRPLSGALR
jgi:hypothetical protein